MTAKRIHQDLVAEHGFDGKYWSVNRFVRALESSQEPPFRRMEVQPGEELQVDFGTGAKIRSEQGTYRRTHVLRCVLSHSRKGYSEAVYRQDTERFKRVLENAFRALGGVPRRVVFDNAKCAVKTPDYYAPELNPKLTEFCKHYQVAFIPTRVRTPRLKGKVELGVDYIQENALRGREFRSLAEQNAFLEHWERTVADTQIHGTTFKHVRKDFETNERGALTKLPLERFAFYHEAKRKVSRDGHISVNKAFYSVPPEYLGREVWVRYDSRLVRILDASLNHVMTHSVIEQGRFRTDPRHIVSEKISPIERGIANIYGKIRHAGPSSVRWAEGVIATRGVEASRVVQGVLTMSHKYRSVEIERACDIAWRSGPFNYRIIRTILKRQDLAEQSTMDFMETHPIIRSIDEYGQFIHERIQERILQ